MADHDQRNARNRNGRGADAYRVDPTPDTRHPAPDTQRPPPRPPAPTFVPDRADVAGLAGEIAAAGGELVPEADLVGALGVTTFDLPSSEDNSVTVVLGRQHLQSAPAQALVRIKSRDGKRYIGIVAAGPFAEPDSLRGDSPMLITIATRGGMFLPPYHGRVQVEILGEELADGSLNPPRLRPLPNSAVHPLGDAETAQILKADGDIRLGLVAGHDNLPVGVPSQNKAVLPRHTAILGTTGGGKSTTVARLIEQAQVAGMAVILLDVEGEYTFLHEPTADQRMLTALKDRSLAPRGVANTLYHLVGRETANPDHPRRREFSLQFARLSPYTVMEILDLSEAQAQRFLQAYDIAKVLLRDLGIFPKKGDREEERLAIEVDEFDRGYPRLRLQHLVDVVAGVVDVAEHQEVHPRSPELAANDAAELKRQIGSHLKKIDSPVSWRALLGKLARLNRLQVFDRPEAEALRYSHLLRPGSVSVVDLSDATSSELSNLVIADLLRGVQEAQDRAYRVAEAAALRRHQAPTPNRVLVIIEEAHEFLSAERIEKLPVLFQQVARIAKRGRKRWLGLVFVTQFPQHLPRQVFGLVNSYILHKLTDPQVVSTLQRTVSGIDEGLWLRLPGLAPGQAIVSFPHMARPLLASVDPTPAKLRMVE
jgi:DNA helicase HerA-like ATPase